MRCKNLLKSLGIFGITVFFGIFTSNAFLSWVDSNKSSDKPNEFYTVSKTNPETGNGCGECNLDKQNDKNCYVFKHGLCPHISKPAKKDKSIEPITAEKINISLFKITAQPRALYTSSARENNTQGVVRLLVVFLASGHIGRISVISGLPNGLTEQAIEAAKNIKFTPANQSVTKTVEYRFTLY